MRLLAKNFLNMHLYAFILKTPKILQTFVTA